jgi:hypothetical protein
MGFNHLLAGYKTVEDMVRAFMADEEAHLQAAVRFIKASRLDDDLRRHDWKGFAFGYNGSHYAINAYDQKLATAFAKWSRISDTPFTPGQPDIEAPERPRPPVHLPPVVDDNGDEVKVPTEKPPVSTATKQTAFAAIATFIGFLLLLLWQKIVELAVGIGHFIGGLFS